VAQAQLLRVLKGAGMFKRLVIAGSVLSLCSVGVVFAQSTVDGLDLEAIEKRASANAGALSDFVKGVLDRQARANAADHEANQAVVDNAQARLRAAAVAARPGRTPAGQVDFDELVSGAGGLGGHSFAQSPMFIAFASLSMPPDALQRMITDVTKAGGMVVFRGFSPDGGHAFMTGLSKVIPQGLSPHVSIDPRLFRAYQVEAVPTYIAASSSFTLCSGDGCDNEPTPYDRIAGNVTAGYALEAFVQGNGPGAGVAKLALKNLGGAE
jgi:conjugal transfer pilus assembly protein TrbC